MVDNALSAERGDITRPSRTYSVVDAAVVALQRLMRGSGVRSVCSRTGSVTSQELKVSLSSCLCFSTHSDSKSPPTPQNDPPHTTNLKPQRNPHNRTEGSKIHVTGTGPSISNSPIPKRPVAPQKFLDRVHQTCRFNKPEPGAREQASDYACAKTEYFIACHCALPPSCVIALSCSCPADCDPC